MKARMEATAAAERIQHCQNSLQAAEGRLAAKKHEINLKVCFKYLDRKKNRKRRDYATYAGHMGDKCAKYCPSRALRALP